ncbi:MAG: hybrid sensor histidine kinase/response regulator, partial [Asticcacaulis sp.]
DLIEIVRQTVGDYRNIIDAAGIALDIDLPDRPVWVEGDPTRLLQVVGNLLHNANKFSNSGGLIRIRVKLNAEAEMASVSIIDSGIGIDPAMLGHVFDVFRQAEQGLDRSRGGLGLGLALVKGLVHLHKGTVEALSEGLNKGAEFRVSLPLAAAPAATADKGGEAAPARALRILLIEDNVDAAESARMLLSHEGHEVEVAFDAESGLALARRFMPDVILCDIGLPGMDGYQIIRRIREDDQLSPIFAVALTGYGRESDRSHALASGFNLHLTKPIDWPTLAETLVQASMGQASLDQDTLDQASLGAAGAARAFVA